MKAARIALLCGVLVVVTMAHARGQDADDTKWYIIDGPSVGHVLYTADANSLVVGGGQNTPGTAGEISTAGHAGCAEQHFHGAVDHRPDPDPTKCGHGRVARGSTVSAEVVAMSSAILEEERALAALESTPPDFATASNACTFSDVDLDIAAIQLLVHAKQKGTDPKIVKAITAKIDVARKKDVKCVAKTEAEKLEKAKRAVRSGIEIKRQIFAKLLQAGLVLK